MYSKTLIIKSLLLSTALSSIAMATPIKLTLSGAITASNMTAFAVGQQANVTLVYESDASYQSLMTQQAFYVNAMTSISFTSGGYSGTDDTDPFGVINLYNNLSAWYLPQPVDGIEFFAYSNAANYTFTSGANTVSLPSVFSNGGIRSFEGIGIGLGANHGAVWNDWSLPENLVLSDFNATNTMLFYFSGGSFMTGISSARVEVLSTSAPPAPTNSVPDSGSTALLTLAGLVALTGMRVRQTRKAT
jgi:hypothetical protein